MAQARTYTDSATSEQLEMRLQQLLLDSSFNDAAYLIAASTHLSSRFQTADVVRLMLEKAKNPDSLEEAAQLVRDLQLQNNEALVTLLINERVRALHFDAAVRLAQEMVPDFEQLSGSVERPCWTPPAFIQAMIRARRFRVALRSAKQFGLLDTFPASQLVAGMLETRSWEEAVSSVMEMQLFKEFPLEALSVEMMKQRQWSLALKCISKLSNKDDTRSKFYEALVRETARVGDFVTSLNYLRELKLNRGNEKGTLELLKYLVDAMIAQNEFYKAIKYAIKFNLAKNPLDDAVAAANDKTMPLKEDKNTTFLPQYSVEYLIRKAMEVGQYHVALTYIKKLRLREGFANELVTIEKMQQIQLLEFRQYVHLRLAQYHDATHQENLRNLLSDQAEDEMIELEPIEMEVVLSEEQEIILHKDETQLVAAKVSSGERNGETLDYVSALNSSRSVEERQQPIHSSEAASQSRFGFARAPSFQSQFSTESDPAVIVAVSDAEHRSHTEPSKRAPLPSGLHNTLEPILVNTENSVGNFNFATFAKSVSLNGPPPPPGPLHSNHQLSQSPHEQPLSNQYQQQGQTVFKRPMPPLPNTQIPERSPGYPMPPVMQQQISMYSLQENLLPGGMQTRGLGQPSPPPDDGRAFDIASLAMQFHNTSNSNSGPRPLMSFPSASINGQQVLPGMSFQMPPLPRQSNFKPSMSYTSVTLTRQKK